VPATPLLWRIPATFRRTFEHWPLSVTGRSSLVGRIDWLLIEGGLVALIDRYIGLNCQLWKVGLCEYSGGFDFGVGLFLETDQEL
jgi:hypothetical protein